ncbi:phage holin, LLH family [Vagococcus xieshaowenii]|uniref:N-acetylmuramoyl-L-alanine amidase n=1 Tax=Vagococcus xieshaowenii TaxID=2562451 RepID=A0AAJ5JLD8_9ENTE|nr:phage holin, LLH family [Vagococcus xieshaowenii]QCA28268.1 N-acetylmuramoyl-L-alanine amidase [Vagococcus xieshaowenii]TFZ41923.1 N-acetylmuramoyl-L-alanine amidase [Vagococcus xieshaowenii]
MEALQGAVLNLLAVIITSICGVVAKKITSYLNQKGVIATIQAKEASVMIAVDAVEQIARNEEVPSKFNKAKDMAIKFLAEQGITVTEHEIDTLIESAVAEINKNVKDELNQG